MGGDDVWRLQYRNHFPPPEVRIDLTEIENAVSPSTIHYVQPCSKNAVIPTRKYEMLEDGEHETKSESVAWFFFFF